MVQEVIYRLDRMAESPDGTPGYFCAPNGERLWHVLEEEPGTPDEERTEGSGKRIQAGTYKCKRTIYHRYGYETFEITGVEGRTRVLFHPGNTEEDTEACVLPGKGFDFFNVVDEKTGERRLKYGVTQSRLAFEEFMRHFDGVDEFQLEVTDPEWKI